MQELNYWTGVGAGGMAMAVVASSDFGTMAVGVALGAITIAVSELK